MTTETDTTTSTDSSQKDCRRHGMFHGRIYGGIWMVIIGGIFLLNNFGYLPWNAWGKLWPLFIIIPGLFIIFSPRRHSW